MKSRSRRSVSVIMPARNVERYVDSAIESVLRQRGAIFELLIADDASTDSTWARMSAYQEDPRVRIWRFRKQKGAGAAGNFLMARARGAYLAFCDADDEVFPGYLRMFARLLDQDPKAGVVSGDRFVRGRYGKLRRVYRNRGIAGKWDLLEGALSNGGTMIRRCLFKKTGGYRIDLPYLGDCEFFFRLREVTRFIHYDGKPFYFYRKRAGSLSSRFKKRSRALRLKILRQAISRRYDFQTPW